MKRAGLLEAEAAIPLRFRVSLGEALGEYFQLGGGLRARDAGLQPSDNRHPAEGAGVVVAGVGRQLVKIAERDPELGGQNRIAAAEQGWRAAHHGERAAGNGDDFTGNSRVRAEAAPPEAVAEDHY